jgi:hypothetical protein
MSGLTMGLLSLDLMTFKIEPFFSNTRQNGEWTEISTRQKEIELAIFGE